MTDELSIARSTLLLKARCSELGFKVSISGDQIWVSHPEDKDRAYSAHTIPEINAFLDGYVVGRKLAPLPVVPMMGKRHV